MHNDQLISWEEHLAWFSMLQKDSSKEFWVLHQNNRPIGVLNFSRIGESKVEWGCYLGETNIWPGSGILLEIAALDRAMELPSSDVLSAEVLSFNKSAIGLHKLFKYPHIDTLVGGERNGKAYSRLYYEYPLIEWKEKRAMLLAQLPKSLSILASTAIFSKGDDAWV